MEWVGGWMAVRREPTFAFGIGAGGEGAAVVAVRFFGLGEIEPIVAELEFVLNPMNRASHRIAGTHQHPKIMDTNDGYSARRVRGCFRTEKASEMNKDDAVDRPRPSTVRTDG